MGLRVGFPISRSYFGVSPVAPRKTSPGRLLASSCSGAIGVQTFFRPLHGPCYPALAVAGPGLAG